MYKLSIKQSLNEPTDTIQMTIQFLLVNCRLSRKLRLRLPFLKFTETYYTNLDYGSESWRVAWSHILLNTAMIIDKFLILQLKRR